MSGSGSGHSIVEVLYPYSAAEKNQISLQPHERITVMEKDKSGWWIGRRDSTGEVGIFPSTYVREIADRLKFHRPKEWKTLPLGATSSSDNLSGGRRNQHAHRDQSMKAELGLDGDSDGSGDLCSPNSRPSPTRGRQDQEQVHEMKRVNKMLSRERDELQKQLERTQEEKDGYKKEVSDFRRQVAIMKKQAQVVGEKVKQLEHDLEEHKIQLQTDGKAVAKAYRQEPDAAVQAWLDGAVKEKEADCAVLERKVQDLERELEEARQGKGASDTETDDLDLGDELPARPRRQSPRRIDSVESKEAKQSKEAPRKGAKTASATASPAAAAAADPSGCTGRIRQGDVVRAAAAGGAGFDDDDEDHGALAGGEGTVVSVGGGRAPDGRPCLVRSAGAEPRESWYAESALELLRQAEPGAASGDGGAEAAEAVKEKDKKIKKLEKKYKVLQEDLEAMEKYNAKLEKKIKKLQRELKEKLAAEGSAPTPAAPPPPGADPAELGELRRRAEEADAQLAKKAEEVAAVQERLAAAEEQLAAAAAAEKARLAAASDGASAAAAAAQAAEERLRQQLAATEERLKASEQAAQERATALAAEGSAAEKAQEALRAQLSKQEGELNDVQADLKRAKQQVEAGREQAEQESQKADEAAKQSAQELQTARDEVRGLKSQFADSVKERELLEARARDAEKEAKEAIAKNEAELKHAQDRYKKEEKRRRELYNQLMELKGNIRVFCRLKKCLGDEVNEKISFDDDMTVRVVDPQTGKASTHEFDICFPGESLQEEVYRDVRGLAVSVLDGYYVCIFAYGQTGSGKTYTMEGPADNRGVNFRTVADLFREIEERKEEYEYSMSVSILEVYNDRIYDLQERRSEVRVSMGTKEEGVKIEPLVRTPVTSTDQVIDALAAAYSHRSVAGTSMNEHSSRSHCVLSVWIEGVNKPTGKSIRGKLHLIDLAGSERLKKSGAEGDRATEATHINKSLTALGTCIRSLANKKDHIPYRDSKLTYLLQDSLGGNCKCLMFANISPLTSNISETISTLRFAADARRVDMGKATKMSAAR